MKYDYDLVIIGGGSAGLVAAELASRIGAKTALVERARLGGDCLWTGCVPSKSLLASARVAHLMRTADRYAIAAQSPQVDRAAVWRRLREVQRLIASTDDSPERFREMGVEVIFGEARFEGDHRLRAGERTVTTKFVLVCTGSRPSAPPIAGLHEAGYLTSQTFFDLERPPSSLAVIGAGPIGVEVAQAMNRLGAKVVLLERRERILEKDEPELAAILLQRLRDEGVEVHVGAELESVAAVEGGKEVRATVNGATMEWLVEDVFVATGRRANIEGLGLETMGVRTRNAAIAVDDRLRTSVEWIYAAGDCAGRYLFTHSATAEAAIAVRNMFFPGSSVAPSPMSWTTFSDPELAHVGMTREEAEGKLGRARVRCWSWDLSRSDRARAESADGKLMVITDNHFRLLGAHLLAPSAGEMIGQFTLAIRHGLRLTPDFTRTIQVYPTFSTSVAQIALEATYNQLQKPFLRAMRWLNRRLLGG